MLLFLALGVALGEWVETLAADVVYAREEVMEVKKFEPREVMIVIDYSNWTREKTQQEILKHLPPVFLKVAECESGTRQYYEGTDQPILGKVTPADTGLFQINKDYHLKTAKRLGIDLDTPVGNIAYAKYLYENQGLKPWSASESCWNK